MGTSPARGGTALSLQFLHPIATTPDPETDASVRLSLLWGRSGRVGAFDLGLVAGRSREMEGLQWQTLFARVDEDLRGAGLTAGVHLVGGDIRGAQVAGLAGWTRGWVRGVQLSGGLAYASSGVDGIQLASLMNLSDGETGFLQASGVANVSVGDLHGLQIAAFLNHANASLHGGQFGLLNFADAGRGAQVGLINLAREMEGLQLGVVNHSRRLDGVPVGLVNLTDEGAKEWMAYGSTLGLVNVAFRSRIEGWKSMVSAGWGDAQGDRTQAGLLAWHFGHRLVGDAERWLAVDVGFVHIMPVADDDPTVNDRLHPALQARLTGDWALSPALSLWAAAGWSRVADAYQSPQWEDDLLLAAGVVLR